MVFESRYDDGLICKRVLGNLNYVTFYKSVYDTFKEVKLY